MIKWEKPMLVSLSGATDALGICTPTGSGDSSKCDAGNSAGGNCSLFGNAAVDQCLDGNAAGNHCGQGTGN